MNTCILNSSRDKHKIHYIIRILRLEFILCLPVVIDRSILDITRVKHLCTKAIIIFKKY